MAGLGESSMSVLERLLANAALRDETGRLRSPEPQEPRTQPPSGVSQGVWGEAGHTEKSWHGSWHVLGLLFPGVEVGLRGPFGGAMKGMEAFEGSKG